MNNILDEFGNVFISEVRDNTYYYFDGYVDGIGRGTTAKKISDLLNDFTDEQRANIKTVISLVIDSCLFNVLSMVENNENIELLYKQSDVSKISDGLGGEIYTEDGWISRFSEYPSNE